MSDDDEQKRVCHNCVGEAYLSEAITKSGVIALCDYCNDDEEPTFTITELADEVEGAFERHYQRTSPDPDDFQSAMLRDKELDYDWWREGEQVVWAIANAASVDEVVAQDVLEILEERHAVAGSDYVGEEQDFDSDSYYEEKGPNDYNFRMEWDAIERSIKERTRFFNRDADAFFTRLFGNLDQLANRQGQSVVVNAGPDHEIKSFYRARAFHSGDDDEIVRALKRPDREIGPPPPRFARAGRMNAQGISVFYGASDPETALAEIRPPVGSRVLLGRFDLVRTARLLDVEALRSVFIEGSIFDPDYIGHLELAQFLGRLSERMTMPVMPDDEPKEYLITQMIADFVAQVGEPPIDGMLYRSVQSAGEHQNVVFFNHASCVAEWDVPINAEVDARTFEMDEDGGSIDYSVIEWVPPKEEVQPVESNWPFGLDQFVPFDTDAETSRYDGRAETLQLDPKSLQVRHVTGVTIATDTYDVDRRRYEKRDFNKIAKLANLDVIDPDVAF
jgi:hypothetical protein